MKSLRLFALAGLLSSALVGSASAAVLAIDPSHSQIGFGVKHLMISTVNGSFTEFSGQLDTPSVDDLTKGKIDVTIKAASVTTANAKRDEHLRSADFFDVAQFPELKFASEKITKAGKGKFKVEGSLTLHGVTKPVTLLVTALGKKKDPWGNEKVAFAATGKLNRKDFGLTWNKGLETGGVLVGEDVALNLDIQAAVQAPAAASK